MWIMHATENSISNEQMPHTLEKSSSWRERAGFYSYDVALEIPD